MPPNRINTREIRSTADALDELISDYSRQVDSLYSVCSELDKMWEGETRAGFRVKLEQDRNRFEKLGAALRQYVLTLRGNADAYDKTEAEAVQMLRPGRG